MGSGKRMAGRAHRPPTRSEAATACRYVPGSLQAPGRASSPQCRRENLSFLAASRLAAFSAAARSFSSRLACFSRSFSSSSSSSPPSAG